MKIRIISAIIGIPLLLAVLYFGGNVLLLAILLISLIGLNEFYNAFSNKYKPIKYLGVIFTITFYALLINPVDLYTGKNLHLLFALFILFLMLLLVLTYPKYTIYDVAITLVGYIYVPLIFSFIYLTRSMDNGNWLVWYIFLCAWGSDTFAYFTGLAIGKRKLAPQLSPKKTIEGSIGGVIGSMVLCLIYGYIFSHYTTESLGNVLLFSLLIGLLGAVMGQIGDLSASAIKRLMKIKDYGKLIPGHGGILDRFDSILFTAPMVYIIVNIVKQFSI